MDSTSLEQKKESRVSFIEEEKTRRKVEGIVVAATLIIFTLLAILVWQIVTICVQNNALAELKAAGDRYEQAIEDEEKSIEFYMSVDGKNYLAFQQGFITNSGK